MDNHQLTDSNTVNRKGSWGWPSIGVKDENQPLSVGNLFTNRCCENSIRINITDRFRHSELMLWSVQNHDKR